MSENQAAHSQRRRWVPCGCLLAMFLTCVFVPVVSYLAWSYRAAGQVKTQFARIQQAGLPTTSDELDAFYRIEPGLEDATALYMQAQREFSGSAYEAAGNVLPIIGNSEDEIPPPGQPWPQQQAVEAFLAEYDQGMQALHKAAEMGGAARFPLAFEQGFAMELPHAQNMRNCARMLALEAHVKAQQGDAAGTAKSLLALATISKSLANQPILVSQLVRVAISAIAVDMTGKLLPHLAFSDEDLVRLQQAFRRDDFKAGIAHSVAGERVMGAEAFKHPATALGPDSGMPQSRMLRGSNEDLALYLELQTDMYEATELPYPEPFESVAASSVKLRSKIATPLGRMRYIMTGMTLPAVESCVSAAARGDGANRSMDAAIAVERFRRREGRLPKTLDELVPDFLPAVPMDPYDGQPIRYLIKPDSYLIYTCGRDRIDNGGVADGAQTDDVIQIDMKAKVEGAVPSESE